MREDRSKLESSCVPLDRGAVMVTEPAGENSIEIRNAGGRLMESQEILRGIVVSNPDRLRKEPTLVAQHVRRRLQSSSLATGRVAARPGCRASRNDGGMRAR